ncbi:MAG: NAD-dependent succinate-semialdehyde dehydrogenase [Pseudomonadota bacterium]
MNLHDPHLFRQHCYVNGQWVAAADGRCFSVFDPATQAELAQVANAGVHETKQAIDAAHAAWPAWRAQTAKQRAALLRRWFELVLLAQDDLARLITAECGKPLAEAQGEVVYAAAFIEWFAEEGKRAYGETIPSPSSDKRLFTTRQPVGVCAAITPWNFPLAMITRKVAPALAAGCVMVLKPAEQTPLSALALAELAARAGIPPGVFNVIPGSASSALAIGQELCANPLVRKLSFTGSTEIGRLLMAQSAPTLKKLSLELGGNAPFIVFDDADLDAAVDGAMQAKYRNAGQTCVCANRFLVQDKIYAAFAERLCQRVSSLNVGNGLLEGVSQGPLIDAQAVHKVETLLSDACALGASILVGGQRHALGGNFFTPTVIGAAHNGMRLAQEEIFGPVAALFRFNDEAQAIDLANATEYGLAAYVYTRDMGRCLRVSEALEYGMVGVNTGLISNEVAPFGGIKQSGMGREGSRYGLDAYLEMKYVCYGL